MVKQALRDGNLPSSRKLPLSVFLKQLLPSPQRNLPSLACCFSFFFQAPEITSFPSAITHLPIPPSASMPSSNHPHGQPYLWPVVHLLAHAWGGPPSLPPPFFHKCNENEPKSFSRAPLTSKGVYKYFLKKRLIGDSHKNCF